VSAEATPGTPDPGAAIGEVTEPVVEPPRLLRAPREGAPDPLRNEAELLAAAERLAAGTGPVAIDAERASGYRYSQRAYLVQLRREGAGTFLIDPIELPDLGPIDAALADAEWILHAATQDLPCLAELGMTPRRLFDTELVGRLLGSERVALGTMLEQYLGISLEKGHSAADWSTRPLPHDWLVYAALDVELLIELREVLLDELQRTGKLSWAEQECDAILNAPASAPRSDPWRRTSGIHGLRTRRQLALVRSLWQARDRLASERDVAPGRTLPDTAIIAAVKANPAREPDLVALDVFHGPRQRKLGSYWFSALTAARELSEDELPQLSQSSNDPDAMPAQSRWRDKDPAAAVRLAACKDVVTRVADEERVVAQNLLAGEVTRRLAWRSVSPLTEDAVRTRLAELGARRWQIDLLAAELTQALDAQVVPVAEATSLPDSLS
jgi:ribonuclease D